MTDMNEVEKIIEKCYWRKVIHGVPICRGMVLPCMRVIDKGQCDTLIEYSKQEREKE